MDIAAGHDLTGTAVQIAGTHGVTLAAGNDLTLSAGNNAVDLATPYSTPESASNMLVVNLYSDGNSGFANALDGAWDAINANWFHGALGSPAGTQALASIAQQVSAANKNGAGINMVVGCHSDGCAQTSIAVQNDPSAFDNLNSGGPAYMLFAEPSANVATVQSALNRNNPKNDVAVTYSCNPNDPVCSSRPLGNNPATEKTSQGCFTMMSAYECSGGIGISWGKLPDASVHSDIGYSNMVTPSASLSGQMVYSWGYSGNPLLPGNPPSFWFAPGAPSGIPQLVPDRTDGGNRAFAPLLPAGTSGTATIYFPAFSVAGSTADHVNYATLVWPGGVAANLGTALSAMNGLLSNRTTQDNSTTFAPSGSGSTLFPVPTSGGPPSGQTKPQTSETPAQQRCIALTGGDAARCLQ